jgi:hypothetical protein
LRWWEGTDWTDDYRAPPTSTELATAAKRSERAVSDASMTDRAAGVGPPTRLSRSDTEDIIGQVRQAARGEIDRAADVLTQRARGMARELQPLVTEYSNRFFRVLRVIAVLVVVFVIAWLVFETIAQQSFFDWLGDRIDNLSE